MAGVYASNSEECPHCGDEVANLRNHVRMSSGGGHGPQGRYPEDVDEPADVDQEDVGADVEQIDAGDGAGNGLDRGDVASLELADSRAEASEYECGECGARLEYHQTECKCGQAPMWRAPV